MRMSDSSGCKRLAVLHQFGGTCWFNALMMALFFSDGARRVLQRRAPGWGMSAALKGMLQGLLLSHGSGEDQHLAMELVKPEAILSLLHREDPAEFNFDPSRQRGYSTTLYLPALCNLLGVRALHLDAVPVAGSHDLYLSSVYCGHRSPDKCSPLDHTRFVKEDMDIVTVRVLDKEVRPHPSNLLLSSVDILGGLSIAGTSYEVDSLLLTNFNHWWCERAHMIAGVTCGGSRFVYNGWLRSDVSRPVRHPCELMEVDWLKRAQDFCLDRKQCRLDRVAWLGRLNKLCFNFHKGRRTYLYVNAKYVRRPRAKRPRRS